MRLARSRVLDREHTVATTRGCESEPWARGRKGAREMEGGRERETEREGGRKGGREERARESFKRKVTQ